MSCAAFGSRWPTTESTWRRTSNPRATSSTTGSTRLVHCFTRFRTCTASSRGCLPPREATDEV
jgi:hypothetical protein